MQCPFCKYSETIVKDSRSAEQGNAVRRRRFCEHCKVRFTSYERPQLRELYVIKRSGIRRPFDRNKIYTSIATAMRKRHMGDQQVEQIVNQIYCVLEAGKDDEIPTKRIGDMILSELAKIDEVAYIRFASVYKDFTSAQDFAKFINLIKKSKK